MNCKYYLIPNKTVKNRKNKAKQPKYRTEITTNTFVKNLFQNEQRTATGVVLISL